MVSDPSTSRIKRYKPYFTPQEVEQLSAKQRGKLSVSREERGRQQACSYIDAVGVRCGFPRRTIATAQTLYMRFHLFFPYQDFSYVEVSLSALYVSSKLHDTLKKPREIILASYAIRFPALIKKGALDPGAIDPAMQEHERKRVLSIERLVLETMCFSFKVEMPFGLVVKLGKTMGLSRELCQYAWRTAVDCHRTPAPLSYPPHVISLGSYYMASLLLLDVIKPFEITDPSQEVEIDKSNVKTEASRLVQRLGKPGSWEAEFVATAGYIDEVAHSLLDLYITILSTPATDPSLTISSPSPVSPKEPLLSAAPSSSTSTTSNPAAASTAFRLSTYWNPQTLTELKIHLRDRRPAGAVTPGWVGGTIGSRSGDDKENGESESEGMGKNDGTVRFVWDREVTTEV